MIIRDDPQAYAADPDRTRAHRLLLTLIEKAGGGYEGWLAVDRAFSKHGVPLHPAFWRCPRHQILWVDCACLLRECYPGEPERPTRCGPAVRVNP